MTTLRQYLLATSGEISKAGSEIQKMAADIGTGHGTLGPDQVKEILDGVAQHMTTAGDGLKKAIDGIPVSQSQGDETNPDEEDNTMIANEQGTDKNPPKGDYGLESEFEPSKFTGAKNGKGDKMKKADDANKKLLEEVASLKSAVATMMDDRNSLMKEKIATEYANLFPPAMRKAKFDEMIGRKDPINILQASLDTAKSLLGNQKVASSRGSALNPADYPVFKDTMVKVASMGNLDTNEDVIQEAF